ncbi:Sec-independent protein translocase protein TatB [Pelagerythrobacter sp.]|uniref:Sec-independent protein translocase protein TatB n=1 Tax=Pelagerythrobacter sp. TaxID=2800702 RepID=UPI0035B0149C
MFDVGAIELLIIVVVAVVVIGPKDMPLALRTAGRWIGKIRRVSSHFRSGIDAMIREAEMEEMEKKWREQNARIMSKHPSDEMQPLEQGKAAAKPGAPDAEDGRPAAEPPIGEGESEQPPLPLDKPLDQSRGE